MRILLFYVTTPHGYLDDGSVNGGWQDSLLSLLMTVPDIEIGIAFEGSKDMRPIKKNNIQYYPVVADYNFWDVHFRKFVNRWTKVDEKINIAVNYVNDFKPDIIHVFGSEWEWGLIAERVEFPVVLHLQGIISGLNKCNYPPQYSALDEICYNFFHPLRIKRILMKQRYLESWEEMERCNFKAVRNYMGRTAWDYIMSSILQPEAKYYHCDEVLRDSFYSMDKQWTQNDKKEHQILTVGCYNHWKGPHLILQTAKVLKEMGVNFHWYVAGRMSDKSFIEYKEGSTFRENNVELLGNVPASELSDMMSSMDIFVQPSVMDNSPNSLCEAQYIGMPIIATMVGGIPSLVHDNIDGLLVPANDPFCMAYKISTLLKDKNLQLRLSDQARIVAHQRHDKELILESVLNCYKDIIFRHSEVN